MLGTVTILDDDGIAAPSITLPASPSAELIPTITVRAQPESTLDLYATAGCSGSPVLTSVVPLTGVLTPAITVAANTSTAFSAKASGTFGPPSPCAEGGSYVHDSIPPSAPSGLSIAPNAPFNNFNFPVVTGVADADSTVQVFVTGTCAGPPVSGAGSSFDSAGIAVSVVDDSITPLSALAIDAAGNPSACVSAGTYIEDSSNPLAPTNIATTPGSPGNQTSILVHGLAEVGSTVEVFTNSSCSGTAVASGTEVTFSAPGFPVTVAPNTTTPLSARATDIAGNVGACAVPTGFVHDSIPPGPPTNVLITPLSPANDNTPQVSGTAESGSTITVSESSNCTGASLGSGSAGLFSSPGIAVTVGDNTTTDLSVRAVDAAGNASPCVSAGTYTEDSGAPAAPANLVVLPSGPANNNTPSVSGTAEAGTSVEVFTNSTCTGIPAATGSASTFATPGLAVSVGDNTLTIFSAHATDAAANTGPCALTSVYIEDSTPPASPSITSASPASNTVTTLTTALIGTGPADASIITIYAGAACSGSPVAAGVLTDFQTGGIVVGVTPGTTTVFYAQALDAAGNLSACSAGFTYVDPAAATTYSLVITNVSGGPGNPNPFIQGTISPAGPSAFFMSVDVFVDAPCTGFGLGSGFSNSPITFQASARQLSPGTHTLYVRGFDTVSSTFTACSAGVPYTV